MEFRKTTVLPIDPQQASTLFRSRIFDSPQANFVVLGSGPDAEALVSKAGAFAGADTDLRWVIWARDFSAIRDIVGKFTDYEQDGSQKALIMGGTAKAFAVNVQDAICAAFGPADPADNLSVSAAFIAADN